LPTEKNPSLRLKDGENVITFTEPNGRNIGHKVAGEEGFIHLSVRVHENYVCQADCAITSKNIYDKDAFERGEAVGIRFQPFFLAGSKTKESELYGQGLFQRGLHFSGTVTPSSISLDCICDKCGASFRIQSFHAGFSDCGYFYSGSGKYTLVVSSFIEGAPPSLGKPNIEALKNLEAKLPLAPDGTTYKYLHPFRCPNCSEPYIDFERSPELRESEYYGNTFFGETTIEYDSNES